MSGSQSTQAMYDAHADSWVRHERVLLSDFTARPRVLEALGEVAGRHVLDLGCGEGFVARQIASRGAASVFGIDISAQMVEQAQNSAAEMSPGTLDFVAADASVFDEFPRPHFDFAIAVFLFNYLRIEEMTRVMERVKQRLAPRGKFIFTVPHPAYAFLRADAPPFYFNSQGKKYLDDADAILEGEIWRRDHVAVPVRCVHKTFSDYFAALQQAGFEKMPDVTELGVTQEHLALDPDFFGPLQGYPLHVLFQVENA